jgi:protein-L-isoaspartate(D-aspartate) O-methyltransferase
VLSAAVAEVPLILIEQLKPGGALVAPVGSVPKSNDFGVAESFSQHLTRIIRTEAGVEQELLIPVVFVPMVTGLPQEAKVPDGSVEKKF